MSIIPTEYEQITYEGRKICDRKDLGCGYCGSCPIEIHVEQMRDAESWVHSSKDEWCRQGCTKVVSEYRVDLAAERAAREKVERDISRYKACFDRIAAVFDISGWTIIGASKNDTENSAEIMTGIIEKRMAAYLAGKETK